ncbi:MAG: hypothetical protein MMC33_007539 [Icmadophila ericetorum]|nr:hypothetical protein [Icmadophila ericetorum]
MTSYEDLTAVCEERSDNALPGIVWSFTALAVVTVVLRLFARLHLYKGLHWEDYLMVAGLAAALAATGIFGQMVQVGLGKHIQCLTSNDKIHLGKWKTMSEIVDAICLGFIKISVCLFTLRTLRHGSRTPRILLWILMVIAIALPFLAIIFLFAFQCVPIQKTWDPQIEGHCYDADITISITIVVCAFAAISDVACAVLPIFFIHTADLQMAWRTKLAIYILVGLGLLTAVCVVGIGVNLNAIFTEDWSWNLSELSTWTALEIGLGINLPSLPALRSLYIHYLCKKRPLRASDDQTVSARLTQMSPAHIGDGGVERKDSNYTETVVDLDSTEDYHNAVRCIS